MSHAAKAFVPQPNIRKVGDQCRLVTQHWRGDGEDAYLPVYTLIRQREDVTVNCNPKRQREDQQALTVLPQGGGPHYGLQWFNLQTPADAPVLIEATIERLMT